MLKRKQIMQLRSWLSATLIVSTLLVTNCYGTGISPGCVKLEGQALQDAKNAFIKKRQEVLEKLTSLKQAKAKLNSGQAQYVYTQVYASVLSLEDQILKQETDLDQQGIACKNFPAYGDVINKFRSALNNAPRMGVPSSTVAAGRTMAARPERTAQLPGVAINLMEMLRIAVKDRGPERFATLVQHFSPRALDFSGLGLTELPVWLSKIVLSVETLDLSNNQLTNLQGLQNMITLKNLNVANNRLTSLQGIGHLPKLEVLYAQNNLLSEALKSIWGPLENLPGTVRDLVLDNNGFTSIRMPRLDSPNLKRLSLNNNHPGLTTICLPYNRDGGTFPFDPLINPQTLERLELKETKLDGNSINCLQMIVTIRAAQNNPIKIVSQNLLGNPRTP